MNGYHSRAEFVKASCYNWLRSLFIWYKYKEPSIWWVARLLGIIIRIIVRWIEGNGMVQYFNYVS